MVISRGGGSTDFRHCDTAPFVRPTASANS
jgi:hypothetical protein